MNDEAEVVSGLWSKVDEVIWFRTGDRVPERTPLLRYLQRGRGGRRVSELGLEDDIEAAAQLNSFEHHLAAELRRDPLRIEAVR
jgi:2-phosphosulfolactate phosphatase